MHHPYRLPLEGCTAAATLDHRWGGKCPRAMKADSPRWVQVTPSAFSWERAALDWLRSRLPDQNLWRAWANFEMVDDHGVAEVDVLVVSPAGVWVIEIKSRPGTLTGDNHTWTWRRPNGSLFVDDNPLVGCDRKAKRLKSLVQRTRAVREQLPFFTPLVFLHTETGGTDSQSGGLDIRLSPSGRTKVVAADGPITEDRSGFEPRPDGISGVMAVLFGMDTGPTGGPRRRIDPTMFNQLVRAFDQAGVRPSNRERLAGSYELLGKVLEDGPGWQDFEARHRYAETLKRRARVWSLGAARSEEERQTRRRAAGREFNALQGVRHPNIVEVVDFVPDAERGPTVIFEQPPGAQRLDLWLAEHGSSLDSAARLRLLRQVADAIRYAHARRLHHRALTPRAVLVATEGGDPVVKVRNWQVADRQGSRGGTAVGPIVSATVHPSGLLDDSSAGYLAPEGWTDPAADGVTLDVFSLGTIGYLLLTGSAPAGSAGELIAQLRLYGGLSLSTGLDGASAALEEAIADATVPEVTERSQSVEQFIAALEKAEEEIGRTSSGTTDPLDATVGDTLDGGWTVRRDLGRGSTARALLVHHPERGLVVLKVALDADSEERLIQEHEALARLQSQTIVATHGLEQVNGRQVLVLDLAGSESGPQTLAGWLRREGVVGLDLLERFGADLIEAVRVLEAAGVAHRDIKPDNLGVAPRGANDELHLVLFDFSLTRAPLDAIRAGTPPYREPFLAERRAWDLHAERYAAAVTLYEMATGHLPQYGDGLSDPAAIHDEATIDASRFDPAVAIGLTDFFTRALRRRADERFPTAEAMLRAWHGVFAVLDEVPQPARTVPEATETDTDDGEAPPRITVPAGVTPGTLLAELGMTSRLLSAAGRLGATTVGELLDLAPTEINRLRGVANQTRRRLTEWRRAFLDTGITDAEGEAEIGRSADALARRLLPGGERRPDASSAIGMILGLAPDQLGDDHTQQVWPEPAEVATRLGVGRSEVDDQLAAARKRWAKLPAVTELRKQIEAELAAAGGVMTLAEAADAVLATRGSELAGALRRQLGVALVRAATETETTMRQPAFAVRRHLDLLLLCQQPDADGRAAWAVLLGTRADEAVDNSPVASGTQVIASIRDRLPADAAALSDARLITLAAGASTRAAVSARLELYRKGLPAAEALTRAQAAVLGTAFLTVDELTRRVRSRFPEAEPLPPRPRLDDLLAQVGIPLEWEGEMYVAPRATMAGISSATSLLVTRHGQYGGPLPSSEEHLAELDHRLQRTLDDGGFLAVIAPVARAGLAGQHLAARLSACVDLDAAFVDAVRDVGAARRVSFERVLAGDADPDHPANAAPLRRLVDLAIPELTATVTAAGPTVLLTGIGMLARYHRLNLIEELRDRAGTAGYPLRTVWVLVPSDSDGPPVLDGHPVPVLGRGQWLRLTPAWLDRALPTADRKTA